MEIIRKLSIENDLGLHARAAAKIVALVEQYRADFFLRKGEREVEGSSILAILTLSCPKGTEVEARVIGDDSEVLIEAVSDLFERKFGESK
jgi:phosphocarrier protein